MSVHNGRRHGPSDQAPATVKSEDQVLESISPLDQPFDIFLRDPLIMLQMARSVRDVANALELDSERFFYVVQHADDGSYYKQFKIPKKGRRAINISPQKGAWACSNQVGESFTK